MRNLKEKQAVIQARINFINCHPEFSIAELAEIFNVTKSAVQKFVEKHKTIKPANNVNPWTDEQITFLKEYRDKTAAWLYENMPGQKHPQSSIRTIRQRLGATYSGDDAWTKEQLDFIITHQRKTAEWISENIPGPGRTADAIRTRRTILGLTKSEPWTSEQLEFLTTHKNKTAEWISKNIPGPERTAEAIRAKRSNSDSARTQQAYRPWTDEQIIFIKTHADKTAEWISENMPGPKRTTKTVRNKRAALGLSKSKPWTEEQLNFLAEHKDQTAKWISENIPGPERTAEAIRAKRSDSDSARTQQAYRPWTDEQLTFLNEHMGKSGPWISEHMPEPKRGKQSVNRMRRKIKSIAQQN